MIRKALDSLYRLSGLAGAVMLFSILIMVIAQMIARWIEVPVTGLTEIAGYCMAATSFFGLGYALSEGAHIRVNLIVGTQGSENLPAEIICTLVGIVLAAALVFYAVKTTFLSYRFQEISQGQDQILTWIPQLAMSMGSLILLIALIDRLFSLRVSPKPEVN